MRTTEISGHLPIYDRLVKERGNVLDETRKAAEQTQARAGQALDRSAVWHAQQGRERAFSGLG